MMNQGDASKRPIRIMELRGTYKGGGGPDKTILLSAQRHDKDRIFILVTYLEIPEIGNLKLQRELKSMVFVLKKFMIEPFWICHVWPN